MMERVGIGQYRILKYEGSLVAHGLGSCIGLFLYDPVERIGGLAHIMLPGEHPEHIPVSPDKYAATAFRRMTEAMQSSGAEIRRIGAILVGGAHMFRETIGDPRSSIGQRNQEAVREILRSRAIPVIAQDVGGDVGRTMEANVGNGTVTVRTFRYGVIELPWKK